MALIISAGTLGSLAAPNFCPRCFWIELRMKKVPFRTPVPGIFSSIDSYVKNVVHGYFDANQQLPPWFPDVGRVIGYEAKMHWSKFSVTDEETGVTLRGVPDEVFHLEGSAYHIVDYKTTRFSPAQNYIYPGYEVQLNAYAYISARVGLAPTVALTLVYLDPDTDLIASPQWLGRSDQVFQLGFTPKVRDVRIRPDTFIEDLLGKAANIDELPSPPPPAARCENVRLWKSWPTWQPDCAVR